MKIIYSLTVVAGLVLALGLNVAMADRRDHGDRKFHRHQYYENSGTFLQSVPFYDEESPIDSPKEPAIWKGRIWYFPDRWCEVKWPYGYFCHYY